MELYHLHLKGNHDDKWKENKEIVITDKFVNRLARKVNSFNDCTSLSKLDNITKEVNAILAYNNFEPFSKMPLHLILEYLLNPNIDLKTQKILLQEAKRIVFEASIFKREMAMENFRKDNFGNLPSRLHCLYATNEEGIDYWERQLMDGNLDIFRIEVIDEPFKTNEVFIPIESSSYEEMYSNSFRYWKPKFKNVPEECSEYLVQGKVKIMEKVGEIKKDKI